MTTDAGRYVLQRLCEEAGIELDDETDYLMPHGARRGAGELADQMTTAFEEADQRSTSNSERG